MSDPRYARLRERLAGISVAVVTPFTADDRIDGAGLRANLRFLRHAVGAVPIHFMLLGSTGEFYAIDDDERDEVIAIAVEEAAGAVPVIVGAGACGTRDTLRRCRRAEALGADAVMLINPYYVAPSREGMRRHIRAAAEAVGIGVMLYNNETPTKVWIDPGLVRDLAALPNLVGIKENALDIHRWHAMAGACAASGLVLNVGNGEIHFAYAGLHGAPALTSILANFAPEWTVTLYAAVRAGDAAAVRAALAPLERLNLALAGAGDGLSAMAAIVPHLGHGVGGALFQSFIKAGCELRGLAGGRAREPMEPFPPTARARLRELMAGLPGM